jgi:hypothetical protein
MPTCVFAPTNYDPANAGTPIDGTVSTPETVLQYINDTQFGGAMPQELYDSIYPSFCTDYILTKDEYDLLMNNVLLNLTYEDIDALLGVTVLLFATAFVFRFVYKYIMDNKPYE